MRFMKNRMFLLAAVALLAIAVGVLAIGIETSEDSDAGILFTDTSSGITYMTLDSGGVEVRSPGDSGIGYSSSITIPSTATYLGTTYQIKSIGPNAFNQSNGISVTLPGNQILLDEKSFTNSKNLSIIFNNDVTVDPDAFTYASNITAVINFGALITSDIINDNLANWKLGSTDCVTMIKICRDMNIDTICSGTTDSEKRLAIDSGTNNTTGGTLYGANRASVLSGSARAGNTYVYLQYGFNRWVVIGDTYPVNFNDHDGIGGPTSINATINLEMPSISSVPVKTGNTFKGYYASADGLGQQYYDQSGNPTYFFDGTGTTTLHAKWDVNSYVVTIDGTGISVKKGSTPVTSGSSVAYGTTLTVNVDFVSGYTAKIMANGTEIPVGSYVMPADAVTFTCVYAPITYDVLLNSNNSDIGSINGSAKATFDTKPLNIITAASRTGYELTGYYDAATGGQLVAEANGTLKKSVTGYTDGDGNWIRASDTTLYAYWTAKSYTITIDKNGGDSNGSAKVAYNSKTLTDFTDATRKGYSITGYYTWTGELIIDSGRSLQKTTDYTDDDGNWHYDGNVTLYAHWTAKTSSITLDSNGGDSDGSAKVKYDGTYLYDFIGASYDGHTLLGYFTSDGDLLITSMGELEPNVSGYTDNTGKWKFDDNVTLYAHWEINECTVTFKSQDGSSTLGTSTVDYGSSATYTGTTPSKSSTAQYTYTFVGWNSSTNQTSATSGILNNITSNKTVYAAFSETLNKYTVTITGSGLTVKNGDVTISSGTQVNYGTSLTVTIAPQTGYDSSITANGSSISSGNSYTVTGDVTFNGTYSAKSYIITLDKNGGNFNGYAGIKYDATSVTSMTEPIYRYYSPTGYYTTGSSPTKVMNTDGTLVANISGYTDAGGKWIRTSGCTLTTHWELTTYTLTLACYGSGSVNGTATIRYGDTQFLTFTPAKKNGVNVSYYLDGDDVVGIIANGDGTLNPGMNNYTNSAGEWAPNTSYGSEFSLIGTNYSIRYNIDFNGNGSDGGSAVAQINATYDVEYTAPACTWTKTGKTFSHWNTASDDSGTSYDVNDTLINLTTKKNGIVTLYAIWNDAYTVTLTADPVSSASFTYKIGEGATVTYSAPFNVGYGQSVTVTASPGSTYIFIKWGDEFTDPTRTFTVTDNIELTAVCTNNFIVDGIRYILDSPTTAAVATYTYSGSVNIPSSVTFSGRTFDVTRIAISAFYGRTALTSVTLPEGLTAIAGDAFHGCSSLSSIVIPSTVTFIGPNAFYRCTSMTSITIPNGTDVGEDNQFALGTSSIPVTCHVYGCSSGKLDECKNSYTTFIYEGGYTVIYEIDGIQYGDVDNAYYGDNVTKRDKPTETGYTFSDWTSTDVDVSGTSFIMPAKNVTITCTRSVIMCTATIQLDGGSVVSGLGSGWSGSGSTYTKDFAYGTAASAITADFAATISKKGYDFSSYDKTDQTIGVEGMTITALWTAKNYDVWLLPIPSEGHTAYATVHYHDTALNIPSPPVITGYTILGYYHDWGATRQVAYADGTLKANVVDYTDSYGRWINTDTGTRYLYVAYQGDLYNIILKAPTGGTDGSATVRTGNYSLTIVTPAKIDGEDAAYYRDPSGQYTVAKSNGGLYQGVPNYSDNWSGYWYTTLTSPITLMATNESTVYHLEFYGNGSTGGTAPATIDAVLDQQYTIPDCTFTRTGHAFYAWNTQADGNGKDFYAGEIIKNLTSKDGYTYTLYAVWKDRSYIDLFSDGSGECNGVGYIMLNSDTMIISYAPVDPHDPDHIPEGYYLEYELTTKIANADGTLIPNVPGYTDENGVWCGSLYGTFYTKWTTAYTITLERTTGTADGSATISIGSRSLRDIVEPVNADHVVTGYYYEDGISTILIANPDGTLVPNISGFTDEYGCWLNSAVTILYTDWADAYHTVTLNSSPTGTATFTYSIDGGDPVVYTAPFSVEHGHNISVTATVAPSSLYLFQKWNTGSTSSTIAVSNVAEDVTLTAICVDEFVIDDIRYRICEEGEVSVIYNSNSGSITIPSSVTYLGSTFDVSKISSSAFEGCTGLTYVTIPDSVTSIENAVFRGCTSLVSINLGDGVLYIGLYAFDGCTSLSSIEFTEGVEVENNAFRGCTGLTYVAFADSMTLGSNVFSVTFYDPSGTDQETGGDLLGNTYELRSSKLVRTTLYIDFDDHISVKHGTDDVAKGSVVEKDWILDITITAGYHMGATTGVTSVGVGQYKVNGGSDVDFTSAANTYTVTYHRNTGPSDTTVQVENMTYDAGSPAINRPDSWTKTGHTFSCWNTEADGTGTDYSEGDYLKNLTAVEGGNFDLYAKWSINKFTVTFRSQDGTSILGTCLTNYGATAVYSGDDPTKPSTAQYSYTFVGWNATTGQETATSGILDNITADKNVYAAFSKSLVKYKVTYELDGAQYGVVDNVENGTEVTVREKPTITGYLVDPWHSDDVTISAGKFTMPTSDVVISTTSYPIDYSIIFYGNGSDGGTPVAQIDAKYDTPETAPACTWTRTGHTFDSWNTKNDGTGDRYVAGAKLLNMTTVPDEIVKLYAIWNPIQYTVTLTADPVGSSTFSYTIDEGEETVYTAPFQIPYGSILYITAEPITGYSFLKWEDDSIDPVRMIVGIVSDSTFTATSVVSTYSITLDRGAGYVDGEATATYGSNMLHIILGPQRPGYDIVGYYTASSLSVKVANPDGSLIANIDNYTDASGNWIRDSDSTLYTSWTEGVYEITLVSASGTPGTAKIRYGDTQFYDFTPATIGGSPALWYIDSDNAGIVADVDGKLLPDRPTYTDSYGRWIHTTFRNLSMSAENNPTYTISFSGNGSTGGEAPASISATYGVGYTAPTCTYEKTGNVFVEWNTMANGSGTGYAEGSELKNLTSDINCTFTLYAIWETAQYSVTLSSFPADTSEFKYSIDDGAEQTYTGSFSIEYGKKLTVTAYPISGYHFSKWSDDVLTVTRTESSVTSDISWFAETIPDGHIVKYELDGVQYGSTDVKIYGTVVTVREKAVKEGYTVTDWDSDDVTIVDGQFTMPDNDVVIYADADPITYTVKFDGNFADGGSPVASIDVLYDAYFTAPACTWTRTGCHFVSWNTNDDGSGDDYFAGSEYKNLSATSGAKVVLYAKWELNVYDFTVISDPANTLSFDVDVDGTIYNNFYGTLSVEYGSDIQVYVKDVIGYTFDHWENSSGDRMRSLYLVTEDTAWTATSSLNNHSVTYYLDGDIYGNVENHDFGTTVYVREKGVKEGYTVTDWITSTPDVTVEDGKFIMPDRDVVFEATSSVNSYPATIIMKGGSAVTEPGTGWTLTSGNYVKDFPYGTPLSAVLVDFGTDLQKNGFSHNGYLCDKSEVDTDGIDITVKWVLNTPDIIVTGATLVSERHYSTTYNAAGVVLTAIGLPDSYTLQWKKDGVILPDTTDMISITDVSESGVYMVSVTSDSQNKYSQEYTIEIKNAAILGYIEQTGTLTYDGTEQVATVTSHLTTVNSQPLTITYSADEYGTYTSEVPGFTNAGEYTVYYKATAPNHTKLESSFKVIIQRATLTVDDFVYSAPSDLTYSASAKEASITTSLIGVGTILLSYYSDVSMTSPAIPKDAGTYYAGISVSEGQNYNACSLCSEDWKFTVVPADLSISAGTYNIVYGDAKPTITESYTGFKGGEDKTVLSGELSIVTAYDTTDPANRIVGHYPITMSGYSSSNYDISYVDGDISVSPYTVTLSWEAHDDLVYNGQPHSLDVDVSTKKYDDTFAISTSKVDGDDNVNVGDFRFKATSIDNTNYLLPEAEDDRISPAFTIAPRCLTLYLFASPITKEYDGKEDGVSIAKGTDYYFDNVVGTDAVDFKDNTNVFDSKHVDATCILIIDPTLNNDNYTILDYTLGAYITQREVTVSGYKAFDRYYDGTLNIELDDSEIEISNKLPDDDVTIGAFAHVTDPNACIGATANIGYYGVIDNNDYIMKISGQQTTVTVNILKVTVDVYPQNAQKVYLSDDPELTYTYSVEYPVSGEEPAFTGSLSRVPGESIGYYPILIGDLALIDSGDFKKDNYVIVFHDGAYLKINLREITKDDFIVDTTPVVYNGQKQIRDVQSDLTADEDYVVFYNKNVYPGTSKLYIKGIGDYSGTLIYAFEILPLIIEVPNEKEYLETGEVIYFDIPESKWFTETTGKDRCGTEPGTYSYHLEKDEGCEWNIPDYDGTYNAYITTSYVEVKDSDGNVTAYIYSEKGLRTDYRIDLKGTEDVSDIQKRYDVNGTVKYVYTVKFYDGDTEVIPKGAITIEFKIPDNVRINKCDIYHLTDSGAVAVPYTVVDERYAALSAEDPFTYAFVEETETAATDTGWFWILIAVLAVSGLMIVSYLIAKRVRKN